MTDDNEHAPDAGDMSSAHEPAEQPGAGRPVSAFLLGIALGVVSLALIWTAVSTLSDDSVDAAGTPSQAVAGGGSSDASSDPSSDPSSGASPAADDPTGPTRMERCSSSANALDPSLRAAEPAMDQWAVHVGAMNKLVAGELTLQQATAFWNQTRVGAQRQIARFQDAVSMMRHHGVDCPAPARLSSASPALRACAQRVAADLRTIEAARTAIHTWDEHVHHMEMLRLGTMSPARATRLWLSLWHQGVRELEAYRDSMGGAPGCR
jgi:hypothetical protein